MKELQSCSWAKSFIKPNSSSRLEVTKQRLRVLIISSQRLNPAEPHFSTVELSQAKYLSQNYDVAILAVRTPDVPLGRGARSLARRLISAPRMDDLMALGCLIGQTVDHVRGARTTNCYNIEGIRVYEGAASRSVFQTSFEAMLASWIRAAFAAYRNYCNMECEPDLLHAHGRFLNAGAFALAVKKKTGVPYIYTEHSTYYSRGEAPQTSKQILQEIIANATIFSTVSPFLTKSVEDYLGLPLQHAVVIPNFVDEIYDKEEPCPPPAHRPFVFVSVTAFRQHKCVHLLIRAFAEAFGADQRYILKICGDGPLREKLKALAGDLGLTDHIEFLGQISKDEVLKQIDQSHVLVVPSNIETFSIALIEALSRGRPVIATRCGGPDSIVDEKSGLLVPINDTTSMTAALRSMVQHFDRYDRMAIRQDALRRFGREAILSKMDSLYRSVLNTSHNSNLYTKTTGDGSRSS